MVKQRTEEHARVARDTQHRFERVVWSGAEQLDSIPSVQEQGLRERSWEPRAGASTRTLGSWRTVLPADAHAVKTNWRPRFGQGRLDCGADLTESTLCRASCTRRL